MDYKIINETASAFGDSVLPMSRQKELSKKLDDMVISWSTITQSIRVCHVMEEIASFCNTIEEFSYCVLLHMGWHQKRGLNLSGV
jgi:hypothetical protein